MAVLIKTGGAWRTTPAGGVSIKYNGQWVRANKVYVKQGGVWKDSGYIGYPHTPVGFNIDSSNFSVANTSWSLPTTGAAVSSYEVLKQDQYGNTFGGYPLNVGGGGYHQFSVAEDQRLQFFVRSVGATGLKSDWATRRLQVGHTQLSHVQTLYTQTEWASDAIQIDLHTGYAGSAAVYVPGTVSVNRYEVHLWSAAFHNDPPPGYLSADSLPQRHVHYITNDVVRNDLPAITLYNPHDGLLYISGSGGGGWGLYAWGTDYSTGPYGTARVNGSMQVRGTVTNVSYVTIIDRYYAANYQW